MQNIHSLNTKTKIILLLVGCSALSLTYLYFKSTKPKTPTPPSGLPELSIPQFPPQDLEFKLPSQLNLSVPNILKIYTLNNSPIKKDMVDKFASQLSFSSPAQTINDPVLGITYMWSENDKYLVVKAKIRKIEYSAKSNSVNKDDFIKVLNSSLNASLSVDSSGPYIPNRPEESFVPTGGVYTQYLATPKIDNLPIISTVTEIYSNIITDNKNNVLAANILVLPLTTDSENRSTISFSEAETNLKMAKMIHYKSGETFELLNDMFKKSVEIKSMNLGYFYSSTDTFLQPVYFFEASGISVSGSQAQGTFVLPAIK
ncbi:MAG: hypothetical protein UU93_C0001G0005 [Candidatus Amesbacteria bacterium GW2011_GWA2_42_12]|uniref:Uncharacterized protein n=1 Tax=Candidatus Amesbacteria bacterium GW2011_GWA2_42_12 TaxID=1618356 RepID=A0A0G0Y915_9BACT|nr:MAG: hypothetical protein UU93_C0001G0005 [Candidatus Amesbacteria bacterium GW2011_GWA2_42_12]